MSQHLSLALAYVSCFTILVCVISLYKNNRKKKKHRERLQNIRRIKNRLTSKIDDPDFYEGFVEKEKQTVLNKQGAIVYSTDVNAPLI